MQVERKTYKDGSQKLYAIDDRGQVVKMILISNAKNILKHI